MSTLSYADIADLALTTQENLVKKGAFLDLQTDLQDHVAVREIWKGRQHKFEGGDDWEFDIQEDHNHSARFVGAYETDGSSIGDTMAKGKVAPRHVNAHYVYDLREKAFQRGGKATTDLIFSKYVGMMVSFYELLEATLWGKPEDSTDEKTPFGIAYWLTRGGATEGFSAVDPTGFAGGRANLPVAAHPRYTNWSAQYLRITKEDLVRKMRRSHRKTFFRSPVSHAQPTMGAMKNGVYTNDNVIGFLEEILEANNMSLGSDVAYKDGRVTFKSTPITYAPYLDLDATDPVYMLDWQWIGVGVMAGWENNLTAPYMVPGKHLVRRVDLDASLNMAATNLRRQTVIYKAAA